MPLSDAEQMLTCARAGDREAIEALLATHRAAVFRYGRRVCPTMADAEDAVQDALWSAAQALRAFRGAATTILSWLFTIVRRHCYRVLRRVGTEAAATASVPGAPAQPSPEENLAARHQCAAIATALAALEPLHREVILLRDIEGLTAPEAAARLGVSIDAVKSRLHRARARLREEVASRLEG
jgi:RNA polymerase sigma-70 factor (ECF subfamily)